MAAFIVSMCAIGAFLVLDVNELPTIANVMGVFIVAFWGMMGASMWMTMQSYPTVPPLTTVSDEQEFYALEHFGHFVEELREQYDERRRLLANCPRTSKRRPVLREMVRLSETRLHEIQEKTCSSQS